MSGFIIWATRRFLDVVRREFHVEDRHISRVGLLIGSILLAAVLGIRFMSVSAEAFPDGVRLLGTMVIPYIPVVTNFTITSDWGIAGIVPALLQCGALFVAVWGELYHPQFRMFNAQGAIIIAVPSVVGFVAGLSVHRSSRRS